MEALMFTLGLLVGLLLAILGMAFLAYQANKKDAASE